MNNTIDRKKYVSIYGPTTGDKIKLGDTCLWIEIEKDYTVYGDENTFGGGKTIRDGMGQHPLATRNEDVLDLVITNAIILDHWGIVKADIGVKDGLIIGIGKAGNPYIMDNVTPGMYIGVSTEIISAENKIITAGCIDSHVHYTCPQIFEVALHSGTTSIIGGGSGPTTGTLATNCTAGEWLIQKMIQATDSIPMNIIFLGSGNSSNKNALIEQIKSGAGALKIHEDWGSTPYVINQCLEVAELFDIQVNIHTDTLNESGYVEDSIKNFNGRTIHTYHTEGAGGGHAPDILKMVSIKNVLPSSTTPTLPYSINTIDEHLNMIMTCHNLDPNLPEDVSFAKSRIRENTIGAEGILHDIGAISMVSSDSHAMGRIGEVIRRTWQTADKMKKERGVLKEDDQSDNFRVKRYLSKYTINPAITHGIDYLVGSIENGKIADLVIWNPAFFGVKPDIVIKGGIIASSGIGDINGSVSTTQPFMYRSMFVKNLPNLSTLFVSKNTINIGKIQNLGIKKNIQAVKGCRKILKRDLLFNGETPEIYIDPKKHTVYVNGEKLESNPSSILPLSQKYFLF